MKGVCLNCIINLSIFLEHCWYHDVIVNLFRTEFGKKDCNIQEPLWTYEIFWKFFELWNTIVCAIMVYEKDESAS